MFEVHLLDPSERSARNRQGLEASEQRQVMQIVGNEAGPLKLPDTLTAGSTGTVTLLGRPSQVTLEATMPEQLPKESDVTGWQYYVRISSVRA